LPEIANGCVSCGALLIETGSAGVDKEAPTAITMNRLKFEETKSRRSFEASVSDSAIESVGAAFGLFLTGRIGGSVGPFQRQQSHGRQQEGAQLELPSLEAGVEQGDVIEFAMSPNGDAVPDVERLSRIFLREDERLRLQNSRIKAENTSQFIRRVVCLFVYAHQLSGREWVQRAEINDLLKDCKVYDSARAWLANCDEIVRSDDGKQLRLSVPGRDLAIQSLNRIDDPNLGETWLLSSRSHAKATKTTRSSSEDAGSVTASKKRGGPANSTLVAGWVKSWKQRPTEIEAHELLKGRKTGEIAVFALWAIEAVTGETDKNVTREQLAQFVRDAFTIKHSGRTYEKALKDTSPAQDLVMNVTGTTFRINSSGRKYAEQLALSTGRSMDLVVAPTNGA
jgi:hypothetical protein